MKCNGPSRTIENAANLTGRKYSKFRIPPMNTNIRDGEESSNVSCLSCTLYSRIVSRCAGFKLGTYRGKYCYSESLTAPGDILSDRCARDDTAPAVRPFRYTPGISSENRAPEKTRVPLMMIGLHARRLIGRSIEKWRSRCFYAEVERSDEVGCI